MELPDLDGIEARANGAGDAPWIVVHEPAWEADGVQHPDVIKVGAPLYVGDDEPVTICLVSTDYEDDPVDVLGDAEFIAHARTDVPALVAALREARADREDLLRAGIIWRQRHDRLADLVSEWDESPEDAERILRELRDADEADGAAVDAANVYEAEIDVPEV